MAENRGDVEKTLEYQNMKLEKNSEANLTQRNVEEKRLVPSPKVDVHNSEINSDTGNDDSAEEARLKNGSHDSALFLSQEWLAQAVFS